ncbi:hypothetical protein VTO42DRAFT_1589 [Malbranchea cinnamomea]
MFGAKSAESMDHFFLLPLLRSAHSLSLARLRELRLAVPHHRWTLLLCSLTIINIISFFSSNMLTKIVHMT